MSDRITWTFKAVNRYPRENNSFEITVSGSYATAKESAFDVVEDVVEQAEMGDVGNWWLKLQSVSVNGDGR